MSIRVLVVDDSAFYRRRLVAALQADPELEVIGVAADGVEAVEKALTLRPDVITMDVEMPVMDGISAVRRIMREQPSPILMFSALTETGAQATLDALSAGAVDFLPKRFRDICEDTDQAQAILCARVRQVATGFRRSTIMAEAVQSQTRDMRSGGLAPELVVLGAAAGGPAALETIVAGLPADYQAAVVIIQQLPASFAPALAKRLAGGSPLPVRVAQHGDRPEPGNVLLAPGDRHLAFQRLGEAVTVRVFEGPPGLARYCPSFDVALRSAAKVCPRETLAVVLSGGDDDGLEGAERLRESGGTVWVQDPRTAVMSTRPLGLQEAGLADSVVPLERMAVALGSTGGKR